MSILLPISLGEVIDKLTILDIKLKNIKETNKNIDIKYEYDTLIKILNDIIKSNSFKFYYDYLYKTNIDIWYLMDDIKNPNICDDKYIETCKKVTYLNDYRYRIKSKINLLYNSTIKEHKGYNKSVLTINISTNNNDILKITSEHIKIISFIYDIINICISGEMIEHIKTIKSDLLYDNTINIIDKNSQILNIQTINYEFDTFEKFYNDFILHAGVPI